MTKKTLEQINLEYANKILALYNTSHNKDYCDEALEQEQSYLSIHKVRHSIYDEIIDKHIAPIINLEVGFWEDKMTIAFSDLDFNHEVITEEISIKGFNRRSKQSIQDLLNKLDIDKIARKQANANNHNPDVTLEGLDYKTAPYWKREKY